MKLSLLSKNIFPIFRVRIIFLHRGRRRNIKEGIGKDGDHDRVVQLDRGARPHLQEGEAARDRHGGSRQQVRRDQQQ